MQAAEAPDVQSTLIANAKIPCVCSVNAPTRTLSFITSRGYLIEYVQCRACGETWQRFHHDG